MNKLWRLWSNFFCFGVLFGVSLSLDLSSQLGFFFDSLNSFVPFSFSKIVKNRFHWLNSKTSDLYQRNYFKEAAESLIRNQTQPSHARIQFPRASPGFPCPGRNLGESKVIGPSSGSDALGLLSPSKPAFVLSRMNMSILKTIFSKPNKTIKNFREEFKSKINFNPEILLKHVKAPDESSFVLSVVLRRLYKGRNLYLNVECFDGPLGPSRRVSSGDVSSEFEMRPVNKSAQVDLSHSILGVYLKNETQIWRNTPDSFCRSKEFARIQLSWNKKLFQSFFGQFELFEDQNFIYSGHLNQRIIAGILSQFGHLLIQSELNQVSRAELIRNARASSTRVELTRRPDERNRN